MLVPPLQHVAAPIGAHGLSGSLGDDRQDVAGGQNEVVLTGVADLGAPVLGVDDDVALGNVNRNAIAGVIDATGAHGHDLALLGLLLGGVGDDRPDAVVCSASTVWTTMRSSSGLMEIDIGDLLLLFNVQ